MFLDLVKLLVSYFGDEFKSDEREDEGDNFCGVELVGEDCVDPKSPTGNSDKPCEELIEGHKSLRTPEPVARGDLAWHEPG